MAENPSRLLRHGQTERVEEEIMASVKLVSEEEAEGKVKEFSNSCLRRKATVLDSEVFLIKPQLQPNKNLRS